jgi:hypothetical protein
LKAIAAVQLCWVVAKSAVAAGSDRRSRRALKLAARRAPPQ